MKGTFLAALGAVLVSTHAFAAPMTPWVIYGDDNRRDVYAEPRADLREIADSTVAMFPVADITYLPDGTARIATTNYGESQRLCSNEPFYNQQNGANCSGALIGEDTIITAGHCISSFECSSNVFVFGFRMQDEKTSPQVLPQSEVYKCKEVIAHDLQRGGQDYAVVKLDRPVQGHRILTMSPNRAEIGEELYVVGHPSGLPTKIADGATVRSQSNGFFVANLDTYGGNSGSAVFRAATNEIVGILVRGEQDFTYDYTNKCSRSFVCPQGSCRGEDVTHISFVLQDLQNH